MSEFETTEIHSLAVACDGTGGALGHPRVYLHIEQETNDIICPYCSRRYVLAGAHTDLSHPEKSAYGA